MTFKADLTARVRAFAPLTALVGSRIYWDRRTQGDVLPGLVLTQVSNPQLYTLAQRMGFAGRLVQFDGWGEAATDADALEAAITAFADSLAGGPFQAAQVENSRDGDTYDEAPQPTGATDFYRTSVDVRIWHRET